MTNIQPKEKSFIFTFFLNKHYKPSTTCQVVDVNIKKRIFTKSCVQIETGWSLVEMGSETVENQHEVEKAPRDSSSLKKWAVTAFIGHFHPAPQQSFNACFNVSKAE